MGFREKIEGYLMKLSLTFQEGSNGTWVVRDPEKGLDGLLIAAVDSLVMMRIVVMPVPRSGEAKLFEELLRLNATDMVHGAYAVDGQNIIIVDTLEAETMDLEEFQASIDAIGLAIAEHYKILSKYRAGK
jgi:hypothetical protein